MDRLGEQHARRRRARASRARAARSTPAAATSESSPRRRGSSRAAAARSSSASSSAAGRKRCWKTIASVRPARSQASTSAVARAAFTSTGFSSSTCLPAAAAWSTRSVCVHGGVRIRTVSIDRSPMIRSSESTTGKPQAFAASSRRAADGANAAATSTRSARSLRLSACGLSAMPRPMMPMRCRATSAHRLVPHPAGEQHFVGVLLPPVVLREDLDLVHAVVARRLHPRPDAAGCRSRRRPSSRGRAGGRSSAPASRRGGSASSRFSPARSIWRLELRVPPDVVDVDRDAHVAAVFPSSSSHRSSACASVLMQPRSPQYIGCIGSIASGTPLERAWSRIAPRPSRTMSRAPPQVLRVLRQPAGDEDEAPRLDRRGLVDRAPVVVDRGLAAFAVGRREESAAAQAGDRQAVVADHARGFLRADLRQLVAPRAMPRMLCRRQRFDRLPQVALLAHRRGVEREEARDRVDSCDRSPADRRRSRRNRSSRRAGPRTMSRPVTVAQPRSARAPRGTA